MENITIIGLCDGYEIYIGNNRYVGDNHWHIDQEDYAPDILAEVFKYLGYEVTTEECY